MKKKILILEPYFGGSHRQFLEGVAAHVDATYTWLTLPARKWKMRMQLAAFWFVDQIRQMDDDNRAFDLVLCSTFVDVAVFRAQIMAVTGWNTQAKIVTYFHENQFVYPSQIAGQDNHQFTAINFTTAVASDRIAFNSDFNRQSFLSGCEKYLKKAADMELGHLMAGLKEKSTVLYPAIDFKAIDSIGVNDYTNTVPVIVWNHRWEHDKDPEAFFKALYTLKKDGLAFKLIVLGEQFRFQPECFAEARKELNNEIVQFGYAESYEQYLQYLTVGDIIVSTSLHEFYGISVIEAVRSGNYPVLPDQLSYPELFDEQYLYKDGKLVEKLSALLKSASFFDRQRGRLLTEKFSWTYLQSAYEKWLLED